MSLVCNIEKLLANVKEEEARLKAGVKCAGPQMRKHLMEVSRMCSEARKEALEKQKSIPARNKKAIEIEEDPEEELPAEPLELKREVTVAPATPVESKKEEVVAVHEVKLEPVAAAKLKRGRKAKASA